MLWQPRSPVSIINVNLMWWFGADRLYVLPANKWEETNPKNFIYEHFIKSVIY